MAAVLLAVMLILLVLALTIGFVPFLVGSLYIGGWLLVAVIVLVLVGMLIQGIFRSVGGFFPTFRRRFGGSRKSSTAEPWVTTRESRKRNPTYATGLDLHLQPKPKGGGNWGIQMSRMKPNNAWADRRPSRAASDRGTIIVAGR